MGIAPNARSVFGKTLARSENAETCGRLQIKQCQGAAIWFWKKVIWPPQLLDKSISRRFNLLHSHHKFVFFNCVDGTLVFCGYNVFFWNSSDLLIQRNKSKKQTAMGMLRLTSQRCNMCIHLSGGLTFSRCLSASSRNYAQEECFSLVILAFFLVVGLVLQATAFLDDHQYRLSAR